MNIKKAYWLKSTSNNNFDVEIPERITEIEYNRVVEQVYISLQRRL